MSTMSTPADQPPFPKHPEHVLEKRLRRNFAAGVRELSLISRGDHILIGLSGGKDSLALLELLGDARRRSGKSFELTALHVRMANIDYRSDTAYLEERAAAAGVPLLVRTAAFEPDRKEGRSPCFLCSWTRRKILFGVAQELGCNKIALGHHQDDLLLTVLMNLTFAGSFATMPAALQMRKFPVTLIRPLCKVAEEDLEAWAALRQYRPLEKVCPYDKTSNRTAIRQLFETMQRLNPEARHSLWHALQKEGKLTEYSHEP